MFRMCDFDIETRGAIIAIKYNYYSDFCRADMTAGGRTSVHDYARLSALPVLYAGILPAINRIQCGKLVANFCKALFIKTTFF